ncbi:LamG domain-containing protein [Nonomuraea sp. NPDC050153]|uniref:LamG domain-containing protein n=1 Tax=Nonomuraea sp. NPDC050153 TaxID=3364359 RepID=UPI00378BC706
MSAKLLLHWQLDDLSADCRAVDSSGNGLEGTVEGTPEPRPDGKLGSCLAFDGNGDALSAPDSTDLRSRTYTVQTWVKASRPVPPVVDPPPPGASAEQVAEYQRKLAAAMATVGSIAGKAGGYRVAVTPQGAIVHTLPKPGNTQAGYASPTGSLEWDVWHHVAVTSDGTTARTYLDGVQIAQGPVPGDLLTGAALIAGRSPDAPTYYLTGALAHLRMYGGALSAQEIQRDMAADESALAAFVRTHPLDFELFNAAHQRVLYIDDSLAGQAMTLRLTNSSRQQLEFRVPATGGNVPAPEASVSDHHVALRFRADVLAASATPHLATPGWSMQATADGTTLYLRADERTAIEPGAWIDLDLTGLNADGAGGTRGTRVELDHQRLGYTGEPDELTGSRLQFLDIVNHRGRPDIPLDVGFVGGDRVLSDGSSASTLLLRIANVSRDDTIRLAGSASAADAASAFVISFDTQLENESREWALTRGGKASDVTVNTLLPDVDWDIREEHLGQRAQWTLTPRGDTALTSGKPLNVELDDIYALASPGHAPVVVAYRNIPGYQDGFVSVMVERTPLLFKGGNVGIGTAAPDAKLHIIGANTDINGKTLVLGPTTASNLRLGHHQDYSWIQSHFAKPLAINPGGNNVGIGTTAPDAKLHIIGANTDINGKTLVLGPTTASNLRLGHHQDYSWIQSHFAKPLAINPGGNNVGIGTTAPGARLTVSSDQSHLQLRRDAPAGSGTKLFLELYQGDTTTPEAVFPNIRFAHANKFSHRIEARAEGIYFKDGDLEVDALRNIHAQKAVLDGAAIGQGTLTIGDVTVGAAELRILKALADGKLQFDLQNTVYSENAYVDASRVDSTRRMMNTRTSPPTNYPLIPKDNVGHWRIRSPFRASD